MISCSVNKLKQIGQNAIGHLILHGVPKRRIQIALVTIANLGALYLQEPQTLQDGAILTGYVTIGSVLVTEGLFMASKKISDFVMNKFLDMLFSPNKEQNQKLLKFLGVKSTPSKPITEKFKKEIKELVNKALDEIDFDELMKKSIEKIS